MRAVICTVILLGLALTGCGEQSGMAAEGSDVKEVASPAPSVVPPPIPISTQSSAPKNAALPADVVAFRAKRDECDQFRGEEPYDAERAAFLEKALERTCSGTDAELKALRTRYASDAAAIKALAGYEDAIE